MMQEGEPYAGDAWPADNPPLTRQALCAKAQELAVALARWKVWRVQGQRHANLQEAQAMQALLMVLIELLDDVHGSPAAVHSELARAVVLLGYTLQISGAGTASQALGADAAEHDANAAFLRTHGLRFGADAPPDAPVEEP